MKKFFMDSRYVTNFWFWWAFLTLFYIIAIFSSVTENLRNVGLVIGVFVPVGLWNFIRSLGLGKSGFAWVSIPLVLFVLYSGNKYISELRVSRALKVFLIFLTLLLLTLVVDLLIWGKWASMDFFYDLFGINV